MSVNLTWNEHVSHTVKKCSKRLFCPPWTKKGGLSVRFKQSLSTYQQALTSSTEKILKSIFAEEFFSVCRVR